MPCASLFPQHVPCASSLKKLSVGCCGRVRTLDSLRILQKDDDGLQALRNLRHDEYLVAWERAYTRPQGRWDDTLAVAALKDVRYAKQRAKQMKWQRCE